MSACASLQFARMSLWIKICGLTTREGVQRGDRGGRRCDRFRVRAVEAAGDAAQRAAELARMAAGTRRRASP